MGIKTNKTKRLSDLALVAYLTLEGHNIINLERENHNKVIFALSPKDGDYDKLDRDIKAFFNREAMVTPLSYFDSIKAIKTLVYNY